MDEQGTAVDVAGGYVLVDRTGRPEAVCVTSGTPDDVRAAVDAAYPGLRWGDWFWPRRPLRHNDSVRLSARV